MSDTENIDDTPFRTVRGMRSPAYTNVIAHKNEIFDLNLEWTKASLGNKGRENYLDAARLTRMDFELTHDDVSAAPYENPAEYITDLLHGEGVPEGYLSEARGQKMLARLNEDGKMKLDEFEQRLLDKGRTGKLPFGKQPELPEDSALKFLLEEEHRGHITPKELKAMLAWQKVQDVVMDEKADSREVLVGTSNDFMHTIKTPVPPEDLPPPALPEQPKGSFAEQVRQRQETRGKEPDTISR